MKPRFIGLLTALLFAVTPSVLAQSPQRGISVLNTEVTKDWGTYHALVIGINDYTEWPRLQTAVKDATVIRELLVARYGFNDKNVILRTDRAASRPKINRDLRYLATAMGPSDNLLIYYAGHGQLDEITGDGYWVPAEGKLKDPTTWVSNAYIKALLSSEKVHAKNVVVIADSCYSGSMLRGGPSLMSLDDRRYREKLAKKASRRSRQVISSGGVEPVADGGAEGHSLFAYYLIDALRTNDREVIDLENLFHTKVWKPVSEIGDQRPNVGRLKTPMDQDGQFVLYNAAWAREQVEKQKQLAAEKQKQAQQTSVAAAELDLQRQRIEMEKERLAYEREQLAREKALERERLELEKQKQAIEFAKMQAQLKAMAEKKQSNVAPPAAGLPKAPATSKPVLAAVTQSQSPPSPPKKIVVASVFPFHITNDATSHAEGQVHLIRENCFEGLLLFAKGAGLVRLAPAYPTDTFYDTDFVIPGKDIPDGEISTIWRKPSMFSNKVEPHMETVIQYVRKFDTNMAILIRFRVDPVWNMKLNLYLVNPDNGKVVSRVVKKGWRANWKRVVANLTESAYAEYRRVN